MSAHKHLTLEDRIMIHRGLDNSSSRKSIADIIGKDKSTVCKGVKRHSVNGIKRSLVSAGIILSAFVMAVIYAIPVNLPSASMTLN